VIFNGELVKSYALQGRTQWLDQTLQLKPQPGRNVLEFRNVSAATEADWLDYVERYPDIKESLSARNLPLEQGGREHWELFGRNETRELRLKPRKVETLAVPETNYFVFRRLRVEGFK
jgi:hypothetical protein